MNLLEQLTKTQQAAWFLNNDLRDLYSGNEDQVMNLIVYDLLKQSAEIENKLKQLVDIQSSKKG